MDPAPSPYNTSTVFYIGRSNFTVTANQPDLTGAAVELMTLAGGIGGTLHGYCIDTYQAIHGGHADVWEVVNLNVNPSGAPTLGTGTTAAAKVRDLQGLFARHGMLTNPTADEAAAMGAAVWEIVNEKTATYSLSSGSFKVYEASGTWASMASDWLTTLSMPAETPTPILYALVNPVTQDFVIAMEGPKTPPVVPEPFTMLTASLAIGGLGMYVRRRSGRSGLAG